MPAVPGMGGREPSRFLGGAQSHRAGDMHPQVSTAEVADAASYMCVAENPAGSAEKLFTLRVQGEPGKRAAPSGSPDEQGLVFWVGSGLPRGLTRQAGRAPWPFQRPGPLACASLTPGQRALGDPGH